MVTPVFLVNKIDRIYYSRTEHTASELDNTLIAISEPDFSLLPSKQPVNRHCSEKRRNTSPFQSHKIYCLNILEF